MSLEKLNNINAVLTFGLKAKDFRKMEIFISGSKNGDFGGNCTGALRVAAVCWARVIK